MKLKSLAGFLLPAVVLIIVLNMPAEAQQSVKICVDGTNSFNQGNSCVPVTSSAPLPITGSISANLAGFQPTAAATATVSNIVNTSQDVALPAGTDAVITNYGSVDVNFRIQTGAGVAVSTDQPLKAGAATGIHVGTATHLSVVAPNGTGTGSTAGQIQIQGGTGLAAGYGGSSGSSGSNGFVAQGSTTSGQTGPLVQGAVSTAAPTYTNAQTSPVSLTTNGATRVLDNNSAALLAAAQAGTGSTGATAPTSAILNGGVATSSQPTAVTNGQLEGLMTDLIGKLITKPFSPPGLDWSGSATSTDTAAHTLKAAGASGIKNYVTGIHCSRNDSGTTPITLTFSDANSGTMMLANAGNGGVNNYVLNTPWATAAATAFTYTSSAGTSTVSCTAEGYQAP